MDSVYNNAGTKLIYQTEPVVAEQIDVQYDSVYPLIRQGMMLAAQSTMPKEYSLTHLGFQTAIKTGTPQSPRGTDSFVIGFAPAENPEIAFAGVIEGGNYAKYMVRKVLELYADCYPDTEIGEHLTGE